MAQGWIFRFFRLAAIVPILGVVSPAQSGDTLGAIQQQLNSVIQLTATTPDRVDIVNPGSVVELRKNGLVLYGVNSPLAPSNTYKNGKIGQGWAGFGKDLAISMAGPQGVTADNYPHRQFAAGERCWVTAVIAQKDGILFRLYSDPFDGIRFYGNLKIPFPNKKEVPSLDNALQLIGEVLSTVSPDGQSNQIQPQQSSVPQPADGANGAAPQSSAPPPTISIGQTMDEVTAAFGQPIRKAVIGQKQIYVYNDMKVTFVSGKVTDVQ